MVKTGVYGIIRFLFGIFGLSLSNLALGLAISTLGLLAILVGSHAALVEKDIKKFLAFSTIANIGYIVLAVGMGSGLGLAAGMFHLLNHALLKCSLFMLAGCVIYRAGTRNIDEMGGLGKVMPLTAGLFLLGALAISGIPPFNAFASKLLVYQAALVPFSPIYACFAFLAIYASVVMFVAFMRVTHSVFFGSMQDRFRQVKEAPASMLTPPLILIGISILFGILPNLPLGSLVMPSVQSLGFGTFDLTSSWLGYMTPIGLYYAMVLSILLVGSFGIAGILYLSSLKLTPGAPVPVKLETMTGGEEVASLAGPRVGSESFSGSFRNAIKPLYNIAERGGFDVFWVGLAKGVQRSASGIQRLADKGGFDIFWVGLAKGVQRSALGVHRRLLTAGYVPVMLLLLAFCIIVLIFLVV
jgi:NADH:ubiquinone oxidoreductase subunit 5 (subunit L)/multisubunit Na+/H+ antiporter MnhA subunit